jgi:hypothetical protein
VRRADNLTACNGIALNRGIIIILLLLLILLLATLLLTQHVNKKRVESLLVGSQVRY